MHEKQKKRFSVSLDVDDYTELKNIAEAQKPPLSLQYLVSYALNEFIANHKNMQVEFDFKRWRWFFDIALFDSKDFFRPDGVKNPVSQLYFDFLHTPVTCFADDPCSVDYSKCVELFFATCDDMQLPFKNGSL